MALKTDPAQGAITVVPSNTIDLTSPTTGIYVGGAGNVRVLMLLGDDVIFVGVTAASILPIQVTRILATGTTATNMLALRTNATGVPS